MTHPPVTLAATEIEASNEITQTPEISKPLASREIICPITGYPIVAARPGQRGLSVDEIKQLLGDFP